MNGIAHSNFAGNMGIEMNPASIATMPYRFEFNILSGDVFFRMIIFTFRHQIFQQAGLQDLLHYVTKTIVTIIIKHQRMLLVIYYLKDLLLFGEMTKLPSEYIFLYEVSLALFMYPII